MDPWMEKFIDHMGKRIDGLEEKFDLRFETQDEKLDKLLQFQAKVIGGALVMSFLVSMVFKFIEALLK